MEPLRKPQPRIRFRWKRIVWMLFILFVVLNIGIAIQAYKLTHFGDAKTEKSSTDDNPIWLALTGVDNPRPENTVLPSQPYETILLEGEIPTECWSIKADSSIGTVVICHGYGGAKSSMLDKAEEFLALHYSVLLMDFRGCGGSPGNQCTIGYQESVQVKSCVDYLAKHGETKIILFGTSMGAVAIMKTLAEDQLKVAGAILECPFGSLYETTCARFRMMGVPSFPCAELMVFWGGIENGFWGFDHAPDEFAKNINVPVLLFYGAQDPKVSRAETDSIYAHLPGTKDLVTFPEAGHENYLKKYRVEWLDAVQQFLDQSYTENVETTD